MTRLWNLFDRSTAIVLAVLGAVMGIGVGALAPFFVSGFLKISVFYGAFLAALWLLLRLETLLGTVFGRLLGMSAQFNTSISQSSTRGQNWLLVGVCIGYAACAAFGPAEMWKWYRSIRN